MHISDLLKAVRENWEFNGKEYMPLRGGHLTSQGRQTFAISHVLAHMNKSMGVVSGELEKLQHSGVDVNPNAFVVPIAKMVVNLIKLGEVCGVKPESVFGVIKCWRDTGKWEQ